MAMTWYKSMIIVGGLLALCACETTKENLGLNRRTPDAFAVMTRAPLSMPPDYYLRPPEPGAPRPQEETATDQAESALWANKKSVPKAASKAEAALLEKTGAVNADPDIRSTINAETDAIIDQDTPSARKLLGLSRDRTTAPAPTINPVEETQRLKEEKKNKGG